MDRYTMQMSQAESRCSKSTFSYKLRKHDNAVRLHKVSILISNLALIRFKVSKSSNQGRYLGRANRMSIGAYLGINDNMCVMLITEI